MTAHCIDNKNKISLMYGVLMSKTIKQKFNRKFDYKNQCSESIQYIDIGNVRWCELTDVESQMVLFLNKGVPLQQIANELKLAKLTVEFYYKNLLRKLNLK